MNKISLLAMTAMLCGSAMAASAQSYPSRPVRVINPNPPGGPADLMGREVATRLSDVLGQPVVVEYKPGAGATIGALYVAQSQPDGYTVLQSTNASLITAPMLINPPPYDGLKDLMPVALAMSVPNVIAVNAKVPVRNIAELVAYAKANPGKLTYGSNGNGSGPHLTGALFATMTGTQLTHVPYKGAAPAMTDQVGGQIDLTFLNISTVLLGYVKAGKLRALALTSLQRSPAAPDIPTADEQGIRGFDMGSWTGYTVASRTPAATIVTLSNAIVKVMNMPQLRDTLLQQHGALTRPMGPDEFGRFVRSEHERLGKIIKESGSKSE